MANKRDVERDRLIAQFTRFITNLPGQDQQSAANRNFRRSAQSQYQQTKAAAAKKAGGNTARSGMAATRAKAMAKKQRGAGKGDVTTTTWKGGKKVESKTTYRKK